MNIDTYFREDLDSIQKNLHALRTIGSSWGEWLATLAQNIVAGFDEQSAETSAQSANGLHQLINFIRARVSDLDTLVQAMCDPNCVSPVTLRDIFVHISENGATGNLLATLGPEIPAHLLPK